MKRRTNSQPAAPPTDQELVDAVAAAGLDGHYSERTPVDDARLEALLEALGVDVVDLAQAQMRLKLAEAREQHPDSQDLAPLVTLPARGRGGQRPPGRGRA